MSKDYLQKKIPSTVLKNADSEFQSLRVVFGNVNEFLLECMAIRQRN
jgi:hypothetical protein